MIIYRYSTSETPQKVHDALIKDNKMRVRIGLNCGFTSGDDGRWIHDYGWPEFLDEKKLRPAPTMEFLIIKKVRRTEIQLVFYYNVLTADVETTIQRSKERRELFEKVLEKNLFDFIKYPEISN